MNRSRVLVVAAVASFVLAGCGGGESDAKESAKASELSRSSASEILAQAKEATLEADTVALKGGGSTDAAKVELDLTFVDDDASGSVTFNGAEIALLQVDGKTYVRVSKDALSTLGATPDQAVPADKWILAPADDPSLGQYSSFVTRDEFFDNLLGPDSEPTKTDTKKVNGIDCIGLKSSTGTLYVALDDARPVSLDVDGGAQKLDFDYSDRDAPKAPAAADIATLGNS